jgi:hypothetical protein
MAANSRRHHQVPKLLLRAFSTDGKVQMRLRTGESKVVGLDSAAVQEHYYAYFDACGVRNNEIEFYLATEVDDRFAPVLRGLTAGGKVDDPETVARFVAWQVVRSPRFRAVDAEVAERLGPMLAGIDATAAWASGRSGSDWSEEQARAVFDKARAEPPEPYRVTADINSSLRLMLRQAKQLEEALRDARWSVAVADRGVFVLGDSPVELFRPSLPLGAFGGFQFTSDTEVRMPLSPCHVLLGSVSGLSAERIDATPELIASVNHGQSRSCLRALFSRPGSAALGAVELPVRPAPLPEPTIRLRPGTPGARTLVDFPPLNDAVLDEIIDRTRR